MGGGGGITTHRWDGKGFSHAEGGGGRILPFLEGGGGQIISNIWRKKKCK